VLHPIAELGEDILGDIHGRLGGELDADAFGADQPNHLGTVWIRAFGALENSRCASSKKKTNLGFSVSPTSGGSSNSSESSQRRKVA